MDQAALFEAIDGAITKVAETESQRLSAGMGEDALTNKVHATLDSFRGLRRGIPPDYSDPWVALFYLTWFQPGQIQLAHDLIDRMKQKRESRRLKRCGSFALYRAAARDPRPRPRRRGWTVGGVTALTHRCVHGKGKWRFSVGGVSRRVPVPSSAARRPPQGRRFPTPAHHS